MRAKKNRAKKKVGFCEMDKDDTNEWSNDLETIYTAMRWTGIEDVQFWEQCFGRPLDLRGFDFDDSCMFESLSLHSEE